MSLAHSRRFRDNFSPGLGTILFDILPQALKPVATVFIGFRLLEASGQEIPPLIAEYVRRYPVLSLLLASSGVGVLTSFVRGLYRLIVTRRERLALGAEYPPWARSTSFLGLDFVRKIQYKWDHGYLGEGFGWLLDDNNATTVGFTMFGEPTVITKDPWFIKSSLATDFESFEKGDLTHAVFRTVLGSGIFSVDGDLWKFHRAMARPFFARHQLAELNSIDRHTYDVVSQIKQAHKLGKALDFQELILRFTLDTATEFFLGSCVHSLKTPAPISGTAIKESAVTIFSDAFAGAQNKMLHRLQAGPHWVWTELLGDKTKNDTKIINDFIEPILKTALAKKRARKHSDASHKSAHSQTMLDHLVDQTDDIVIIRDQLMSVMIAGRDTTAATIAFVVYQLSQHPEVLAKLRQEVLSILGTDTQPSLDTIKEMKYMKAVTQETLRLYPPLPFNFRMTNRNTTVTDPETGKKLFIAKGTTIFHAFYAMHTRKDLWGEDALDFDPERWIDERKERVLKNPFIWLPFQAGPRICLGQQFAMNEIAFFMARLLQTIDRIELCPGEWPEGTLAPEEWKNGTDRRRLEVIKPKSNLTIFIEGGLWVKMHPATSSSSTISTGSGASA